MTTIDTTPEAIAALTKNARNAGKEGAGSHRNAGDAGRVAALLIEAKGGCAYARDPRPHFAAARDLVPALAAEIARLTDAAENHNAAWVAACDRIAALEAERDALNEELREARMQAIADGVQFQMDMEDLTAERDEARALLAILHGEEGMGNVTPADATAALARRDAAMRNEGRRQVIDHIPEYKRRAEILAALEPEGGE